MLVKLASPSDERLISALKVATRDPNVHVRSTAIHALAYVVQNSEAIGILEQSSDDEAKELLLHLQTKAQQPNKLVNFSKRNRRDCVHCCLHYLCLNITTTRGAICLPILVGLGTSL